MTTVVSAPRVVAIKPRCIRPGCHADAKSAASKLCPTHLRALADEMGV